MQKALAAIWKVSFAALFGLGGANHFVQPDLYVRIMPPYLPFPLALVYLSGGIEIMLAVLLLIPRLSGLAAWGLIALLITVFPANVYMAMNPELFPDIHPAVLYARLPLQGMLIAWGWVYTRPKRTAREAV